MSKKLLLNNYKCLMLSYKLLNRITEINSFNDIILFLIKLSTRLIIFRL